MILLLLVMRLQKGMLRRLTRLVRLPRYAKALEDHKSNESQAPEHYGPFRLAADLDGRWKA